MTTPPEDVAALFDLPPTPPTPPEASESTPDAAEAAQAALAAELAATIGSGGVADDAPDARTDLRVKVRWPARMQLPNGRVIELQVRDISETGVGLTSDEDIPAHAVVDFEMDVPQPDDGDRIRSVKGTIKTSYRVAQGPEILCGGTWQAPPADLDLVNRWVERLRD